MTEEQKKSSATTAPPPAEETTKVGQASPEILALVRAHADEARGVEAVKAIDEEEPPPISLSGAEITDAPAPKKSIPPPVPKRSAPPAAAKQASAPPQAKASAPATRSAGGPTEGGGLAPPVAILLIFGAIAAALAAIVR